MNPFDLPGLTFIGYVKNEHVNHGAPVPLFQPAGPHPGQLSINTLEGWNASCDRHHRESFRRRIGRDPVDDNELDYYVQTGTGYP